jgi:hypothetical protein
MRDEPINRASAETPTGNPYASLRELTPGSPFEHGGDRRSEGLNGQTLDELMRTRWRQGYDVGRQEGHETSSMRWPEIYDEGTRAGAQTARQLLLAEVFEIVGEHVGLVLEELKEVSRTTGSTAIKENAQRSVTSLGTMAERLGELRDPS